MSLAHWCYSVALGILLIGFSEYQTDLTMSFEKNSVSLFLYTSLHIDFILIFVMHIYI